MTAWPVRVLGAMTGALAMLAAGGLAGGWWWIAAGAGVVGAAGAVADRQFTYVQVFAALATSVALTAESASWFVPVVAGATIGSIELAAAADRTTVVDRRVRGLVPVAWSGVGAAALTGTVLVAGEVPVVAFSGTVVVAALGAVVATRVIAR